MHGKVGKYFKVLPKGRGVAKASTSSSSGDKQALQWNARWVESISSTTGWIYKHMPKRAGVTVDETYGRWIIAYPYRPLRSVSWTKRGHVIAAKVVLQQLWEWETDRSGDEPPFRIDDLLADSLLSMIDS